MDVVQIQDVCSHKATQRFRSEQVQPSVRQPFPEPFHRHHELFGQSHRDGVVVIRFGGLLKAILTQFASFLRNIGAQLIEFGVMIIAFKTALKSVLANPWAAIAVGAAMVAAAAIMTALINKNAKDSVPALATGGLAYGKTLALVGDNPNAVADPEVIAPLSKLQAMLPASGASQKIQITLGGQLTAKGRDLVYVLGKENFKTSILGG